MRGTCVCQALESTGGDVSGGLEPPLRPVQSLGLLDRIGDIVVVAETRDDLSARVAGLAESEPTDSRARQ